MPVMSVVVSIRSRIALGRLSWSSIWASLRLMNAPVSGPVCVLLSTPTTVKLWLTKSALASGGRIGNAIVSPAFFLNSTAKSEPRTTSPEEVTSRPCARVVLTVEYSFARGTTPDFPAEIRNATVDQGVEFLGHRAHRDEREYADYDAADRQRVAQLSPREISNDFHVCSSSGVGETRLTAGYCRTELETSRSGQLFRMTCVMPELASLWRHRMVRVTRRCGGNL